jgi:outer membrane protein assembly factor BamB
MPHARRNGVFFACFRALFLTAILAALSSAPAPAFAADDSPDALAARILADTGVTGGVIVHLGCGDGALTAALHAGDAYVVQGLDADPANVEHARAAIRAKHLYGPVSADTLRGDTLPYADNLVNLLVVEHAGRVARDQMLRVLAPSGVLYVNDNGKWTKTIKPRPGQIDQWTHFLHGPDGNAVAKDADVGPPRYLQWIGGPKYSRGHEQQASFSSCVTADGRLFYIADLASPADIRFPAQWTLVARDAFNGVVLWQRPMQGWVDPFRRFRSGPISLNFRLVAEDNLVFITFDFQGPVSVLDAATGKTLRVIEGSDFTSQITYRDGQLYLLIDKEVGKIDEIDTARRRGQFIPRHCQLMKADAKTGERAWLREIDEPIFTGVALRGPRLFAQTPKRLICLDEKTGQTRWEQPYEAQLSLPAGKISQGEMQWEAPAIIVGPDAVYSADFKAVHAYAVEDGKPMWTGHSASAYNAPPDLQLIGGLIWMEQKTTRVALDPLTGKVVKEFAEHRGYMHPRCYRNKATENYLMLGLMGVQMLDVSSGEIWDNDWVRGTCQYGVMPANGMLYRPPDSCACNMKTKLSGLYALASKRKAPPPAHDAKPVLEKGPAYGKVDAAAAQAASGAAAADDTSSGDWPTFRGGPGRNGVTEAELPTRLRIAWNTPIGGKLSSVVIAGGKAYVAAIDSHTVHALDAATGKPAWTFTAGGPIDSPPTVHAGVVYFGSADGWVYAVRAADGQLVWRLRAAPDDVRIADNGQLESPWPVHGSVLFHEGELKFTAGRSSYLDGGIRLYRVEPATGRVISQTDIYSPDAQGKQPTGGGKDVRGVLDDVLLADGHDVYMRHLKLNFDTGSDATEGGTSGVHMFTPIGFLDGTWWHRAYWLMGDHYQAHWSGWWRVGNEVPAGRILAYDDHAIYGFGRDKYPGGNSGQWRSGEKYQLFAVDRATVHAPGADANENDNAKGKAKAKAKAKNANAQPKREFEYRWARQVPLLATGLVAAKNAVFIAGPPDMLQTEGDKGDELLQLANPDEAVAAWQGQRGGLLFAAAAPDGKMLTKFGLPSPTVFDGLSAAQHRLYLALQDGSVMCLRADE